MPQLTYLGHCLDKHTKCELIYVTLNITSNTFGGWMGGLEPADELLLFILSILGCWYILFYF